MRDRYLYKSTQSGSRDTFGAGNKYITPMIANGHVYVGATNGVAVSGLLQASQSGSGTRAKPRRIERRQARAGHAAARRSARRR
jgi:hypothetical protein